MSGVMRGREQRAIILLLLSSIGVVGANSLVLSPIAADVARSFAGTSATDVMLAAAAYGAGTALSALLLAPKADQIGLGRSLFWALITLAISLCISAAAPLVWVLIAAQGAAGLAAGVALPAIYGLSAEIAEKGHESETLGKVLTGWTLSLVIGVTFSSMLSDWVSWRAVFFLLALVAALLAVLLARSGRAKPTLLKTDEVSSSPLKALRIAGLPPLLLMVSAYMVAFYGAYAFLGTHLTEQLGVSTTIAGLAALSYGIGFGAVTPLDHLIDQYGEAKTAPFIFLTLTLAYTGLAIVSETAASVIVLCALWGAANHLGLNLVVGALTALQPTQRATILGLYSAVTYASTFAGTIAYKPLFEAQGFMWCALLSALCILPATLYAVIRYYRSTS